MKKKIEEWKIADLKPNPRQAALFPDLNLPQLEELADNIRVHGLQQPVEIRPDGTIICGHQRVRAARLLKWTQIEVWVRDDLEARGGAACEERLIEDNLLRRQVDGLARARCLRRLKEIELSRPIKERRNYLNGDLRDIIAEKLGCKGRNADRYLKVLEAPVEVQSAFDRGELSLVNAGRVAGLAIEDQQEIVERIRAGENPRAVAMAKLRKEKPRRQVHDVFSDLQAALRRCGADLRERVTELCLIVPAEYKLLRQGRELLDLLIERAEVLAVENGTELTP